MMSEQKTYKIINIEKALAPSEYEISIWNDAIEAAAKSVDKSETNLIRLISDDIRKLRK